MRPFLVVPANPSADDDPCLGEGRKVVLPAALLLQSAEEALDDAVLLRGIWGDEFLGQPVVTAGRPESFALEDEAIVAAHDGRRAVGAQSSEASDTGLFQSPLCLFGP